MSKLIFELILSFVAAGVYFLPAIIADRKRAPDLLPLAVMNALLGWSVVGWVVTLYWALHSADGMSHVRRARAPWHPSARAHATVEVIVARSHQRGPGRHS